MTDLQRDVLRMLRVFGPCSSHAIARRLGVSPSRVYRTLSVIVRSGLADHPKLQEWDLSDLGRKWFSEQPGKPLGLYTETEQKDSQR